jgi:hypothetical protein
VRCIVLSSSSAIRRTYAYTHTVYCIVSAGWQMHNARRNCMHGLTCVAKLHTIAMASACPLSLRKPPYCITGRSHFRYLPRSFVQGYIAACL